MDENPLPDVPEEEPLVETDETEIDEESLISETDETLPSETEETPA